MNRIKIPRIRGNVPKFKEEHAVSVQNPKSKQETLKSRKVAHEWIRLLN